MEEKLNPVRNGVSNGVNEKFEEPSLERIREVAEKLKKVAGESKKENPQAPTDPPPVQKEKKIAPEINPIRNFIPNGAKQQGIISNGAKFAEIKTEPSDFTQERVKLERLHQELNTLREKLIQRIELLKTLEKRKKEIDSQLENLSQQLTSLKEEDNDFLEEIKNKLENWEI